MDSSQFGFPEHSHIPTSRRTPFHSGGELPEIYKEFFDPFVGLTAAAAVTSKLKLGNRRLPGPGARCDQSSEDHRLS